MRGAFVVSTDGPWRNFIVKTFEDAKGEVYVACYDGQLEQINKAVKWEVWRTSEGPSYGHAKSRGVTVGALLRGVRNNVKALDIHLPGLGNACLENMLHQKSRTPRRKISTDLAAAKRMAARLAEVVRTQSDALGMITDRREGSSSDPGLVSDIARSLLDHDSYQAVREVHFAFDFSKNIQ